MQLTYHNDQLQHAVALAARGSVSRVIPVLACVLLETGADGLRVTGCDLEVAVTAHVPLTPDAHGAVCVPAKTLTSLLGEFSKHAAITITHGEEDSLCTVLVGTSRYRLHALPASEFPPIPALRVGAELTLSGATWRALCRRAGFCVAEEESKGVLTGMQLMSTGRHLAAASTDSHRLAAWRLATEAPEVTAVIPGRMVDLLLRLVEPAQEITLRIGMAGAGDAPALEAVTGGVTVRGRLIEGTYPDWQRVMPADPEARCTCNRAALLAAAKRAAILARATNNRLRLLTTLTDLQVCADDCGAQVGSAVETVPAEGTGPAWEVGVNAAYLLEALEVSTAETVTLRQGGPLSPLMICDDDAAWQTVIMPMKIEAR